MRIDKRLTDWRPFKIESRNVPQSAINVGKQIGRGSLHRVKLGNPLRWGRLSRPVSVDLAWQLFGLVLVAILALQVARLVWAVVAPTGPVGDWQRSASPSQGGVSGDTAARFDPFFRLAGGGEAIAVTSLSLKLYGVRQDFASGRGSAIIATPDGVQSSFAVGDVIIPGVTLKQVSGDSVTISRDGSDEQIFLDQSVPATAIGLPSSPSSTARLSNEIALTPRIEGGQVKGLTINPQGSGSAFRAAGLQSGDVLLSINGTPLRSLEESVATLDSLAPGGTVTLQIERGGKPVTINTKVGG